jgi:hypothetical protein
VKRAVGHYECLKAHLCKTCAKWQSKPWADS